MLDVMGISHFQISKITVANITKVYLDLGISPRILYSLSGKVKISIDIPTCSLQAYVGSQRLLSNQHV